MINKPAFIVDGHTEQLIVQRICPNSPVRRTNMNGRDVSISAIVNRISQLVKLWGNRHYPIIVLVDREQRRMSCRDMAMEITNGLADKGIDKSQLRVGVADRMIENWIVADWESLGGEYGKAPSRSDGCNGASIIKGLKGSYSKTIDGLEYFSRMRSDIAYAKSPSFKHFIDELGDMACEYLKFKRN